MSVARLLSARRLAIREFAIGFLLAAVAIAAVEASGVHVVPLSRIAAWYEALLTRGTPAESTTQKAATRRAPSDFVLQSSPFLDFTRRTGFRFHPIIDMVGSQFDRDRDFSGGAALDSYFENRDFFGFRNRYNAYFEPGDYLYIVITGNSEALGFSHSVTIAQRLEKILSERTGRKYRVVNLAVNAGTMANEINYFLSLGFNLHPQFVISHSFATDMIYGALVPPEFQAMGLIYSDVSVGFSKYINAADLDASAFKPPDRPPSEEALLEGYLRNARRYRAIAEASGAKFILGIQKFDPDAMKGVPGPFGEVGYGLAERIYRRLRGLVGTRSLDVEVIDFNAYAGIKLSSANDPIHTTDESAEHIAEIYAERILAKK